MGRTRARRTDKGPVGRMRKKQGPLDISRIRGKNESSAGRLKAPTRRIRAPPDESWSRVTNQSSVGRMRALWDRVGPCGTDQGPQDKLKHKATLPTFHTLYGVSLFSRSDTLTSRVEFPIQLVGRLPHQVCLLPHQLYGLPHQFSMDFRVFRLQNVHVNP